MKGLAMRTGPHAAGVLEMRADDTVVHRFGHRDVEELLACRGVIDRSEDGLHQIVDMDEVAPQWCAVGGDLSTRDRVVAMILLALGRGDQACPPVGSAELVCRRSSTHSGSRPFP